MIIKKYGNYAPQLHPSVRVAENAAIVGNVTMEKDVSVWYSAVVRAEQDSVTVGAGTNIQDNVVIHCDAGAPVKIGKNVIIGHGAIVHSCTIGDNCMIGMGAILLSGCKIGEGSIIGRRRRRLRQPGGSAQLSGRGASGESGQTRLPGTAGIHGPRFRGIHCARQKWTGVRGRGIKTA